MRILLKGMLPVLLLALAPAAVGQNSIVKQYSALVGDSVLIRTDNTTFVTCCNTTNMRSCFVVDNGTTCHQFFTTQVPSGIYITDSGYVVKDMQLVNGVCWFAGYKWFDTGQPVYTPGGEVYNLVTYKAFVGKFNTANVLSGSGNYSIIEVSGLHHIERLAVIGNNVTAIGVKANGVRNWWNCSFNPLIQNTIYTLKTPYPPMRCLWMSSLQETRLCYYPAIKIRGALTEAHTISAYVMAMQATC